MNMISTKTADSAAVKGDGWINQTGPTVCKWFTEELDG
jgi:hypothetical protein